MGMLNTGDCAETMNMTAHNKVLRQNREKITEVQNTVERDAVPSALFCIHSVRLRTDAVLIAQTCTNDADVIYSVMIHCFVIIEKRTRPLLVLHGGGESMVTCWCVGTGTLEVGRWFGWKRATLWR
ncbi:hypothetical protein JOB18_021689 [Solea senegalensis]|uniref:Uncharacterized protein n=1 Tax=Solea senegalensis TaxID=28829 RepID=A0AAV6R2K3_SOLSE|nr:hypothetical protein JOB18_021689 [Solea senegalensis]